MIKTINQVSLALLIAIASQYFIMGVFTYKAIDFASFSLINWVLEIIYLTFAISLVLREDK